MGVDVSAIAGYGIVLNLEDYDDEVREALGDDLYVKDGAFMGTRIGGEGDNAWFVGYGGETGWRRPIQTEPLSIPTDLDVIRGRIRVFLEEIALPNGETAFSLYDESKFGFYVNLHVY